MGKKIVKFIIVAFIYLQFFQFIFLLIKRYYLITQQPVYYVVIGLFNLIWLWLFCTIYNFKLRANEDEKNSLYRFPVYLSNKLGNIFVKKNIKALIFITLVFIALCYYNLPIAFALLGFIPTYSLRDKIGGLLLVVVFSLPAILNSIPYLKEIAVLNEIAVGASLASIAVGINKLNTKNKSKN